MFASEMSDDHENASEMDSDTPNYDTGIKRSKNSDSRFRIPWKQKALALKHFDQTVPKMKLLELADWCKTTFKYDRAPAESTVSLWLKPATKSFLLKKLEEECSPYVLKHKTIHTVRFPEIESRLIEWFHAMENRGAVLTDQLLQQQAKEISKELNVTNFSASKGWIDSVKKRAQIKQIVCHGEAGSADIVNVAISQSTCSFLFRDSSADDIYNADETGLFWRALPSKTLATKMRQGHKLPIDRITIMLCCNASGTHKLMPLVINKSEHPRSFGKWLPEKETSLKGFPIMYRWNS